MAPLNWQKRPEQSSGNTSGGVHPLVVSSSNPWFGVSMGLLGLIVGFGIATIIKGGTYASAPTQQVAQAPTAPNAPSQQQPPAPQEAGPVPPIDIKKDHIRGNPNATVAVIQYSSFPCPFSQRVQATYKQIVETYGDKVMVVYRHFPLSFQPNAEPAAVASECVAELGGNDAFWKFLDKLYATDGEWNYPAYAKEAGVNEAKFNDCIASGRQKQLVQDHLIGGSAAGVSGSPGNIILNIKTGKSQFISGSQPFASFKAAIDAML